MAASDVAYPVCLAFNEKVISTRFVVTRFWVLDAVAMIPGASGKHRWIHHTVKKSSDVNS